jgi:chaperonin GroEL
MIADNAGLEGAVVVKKITQGTGAFGYDADKDEYCDLVKAGVVDPAKVVRSALQNAVSVACLLLTTDAMVSEIPEKKPAMPPGGPHGHGGMGGGMGDMGMM